MAQNGSSESGLYLLEHINVNVGEWPATQRFYEALGCQHAQMKIHMNCGPHTQFHMPVEPPVQVWRGEITVAYTAAGLGVARERLSALGDAEVASEGDVVLVKDPWGNRFRLREGNDAEKAMAALPTKRPNTEETTQNGVLGIVEVTLPTASGTSARLAKWYEEVFQFHCSIGEGGASVLGGPVPGCQKITFVEQSEVPPYTGDHFCFYIRDFENIFTRCMDRKLLYVNPRFTWLDDSNNLEQARHWQAYRIMEVKEGDDQPTLLHEEHEIRSMGHKFLSLS